jgi:hypothetical protein
MLARMLRTLIDPASSSVCRHPRNSRDLLRLAWNNYVLVFDHVTRFPDDIADSLCRLSSGAGFAFDEQTDGSDALVRLQRPIILTTPRCDSANLRNRAIVVDLPAIQSRARRSEIELINEFFDAQPRILGRMCVGLSRAMSAAPAATGEALPAFFDAAAWAIAAAPALGISEERMRAALTADPFTRDLAAFFHEAGTWEGTATALYAVLKSRGAAQLPATPARLSRKLLSASLRTHGIHLEHAHTHSGRRIRATVAAHSTVAAARTA